MGNQANAFGRSTSIPLLQEKNGAHGTGSDGRPTPRNAFRPMAALQEQDNFRSQNASIWSPNGISYGFLSPPALGNIQFSQSLGRREISPNDVKGSAPADVYSTSPDRRPAIVSNDEVAVMKIFKSALLKHKIRANNPVSQPEAQSGMTVAVNPFSPRQYSTLGSGPPLHRSPLFAAGEAKRNSSDESSSSGEDNGDTRGSDKEPSKNRLPGLGHISPVTDTFMSAEERKDLDGDLEHRRHSSRLSSLPIIPSPLGPRHNTNGGTHELAGTSSPMPSTPAPKSHSQGPQDQNNFQMFGLDTRDFNGQDGCFNTKPFGFGHSRKPTDPFVEPADKWSQPLKASPFVIQAQQNFAFPTSPDAQIPSTPVYYAQEFEPLVGSSQDQGSSSWSSRREQAGGVNEDYSPYQSGGATPLSFQGYNNPATRMDLPIPPPPLATAQGHLIHSPGARARLDAQADIRGDWICNEAKKVADLSRLFLAAAKRFQQTQSVEDYEVWQRLASAYDDVTRLEKRQEERRNMFMPSGMRAMKTGPDNIDSDQSAAYAADADAGGQGDGKLLGFQMAYMERVCAEVKRRAEEEDEGHISPEMLDTLNLDEKKALREHLVARLQSGTAARKATVLSESFL